VVTLWGKRIVSWNWKRAYFAVDCVIAIAEGYRIDYHWHNIPSKTVTHFLGYRPYIGKKKFINFPNYLTYNQTGQSVAWHGLGRYRRKCRI